MKILTKKEDINNISNIKILSNKYSKPYLGVIESTSGDKFISHIYYDNRPINKKYDNTPYKQYRGWRFYKTTNPIDTEGTGNKYISSTSFTKNILLAVVLESDLCEFLIK